MRYIAALALLGLACGHERSYDWGTGPEPHGPIGGGSTLPRRITFNPADDRNPSTSGGTLVFSRLPPDRPAGSRERCVAFLPVEGGTLSRTLCPPMPLTPGDTFVHTWVEPSLSPDGTQIAYAWQRGSQVGYYTWTRDLAVASVSDPGHPTHSWQAWYVLPDGRIATAFSKITWLSPTTLRMLASYERVFKVKGGGADRLTDTVIDVFSLIDVDITTGAWSVVPGADSTIAYAPAPGGGYWLVKSSDSTQLWLLENGVATPLDTFSGPVMDIANVDGVAVAVRSGGLTIEWPGGHYDFAAPVSRIVAVPGKRLFVAEVEKSGIPLDPAGANLWLFGVP